MTADTAAEIRARLDVPCARLSPHQHCWDEAPARAALRAVLDLCADDYTGDPDDPCARLLYPRHIRAAIADALGVSS